MVPLNMTYLHCLQHSLFEHLFKLYSDVCDISHKIPNLAESDCDSDSEICEGFTVQNDSAPVTLTNPFDSGDESFPPLIVPEQVHADDHDVALDSHMPDSIPHTSRPQRSRKPPKYLDDYVR